MKKLLMIIFVLFLIVGVYALQAQLFKSGFDFEIINQTSEDISGLALEYGWEIQNYEVPVIKKNSSIQFHIETEDVSGENRMNLVYQDRKGLDIEELVIGYFEQGYSGSARIVIKGVDDQGKLDMNIHFEY